MLPGVSRRAWWWLRGGSHRTRGWLTICLGVAALAVPSAVAHGADGAPPSPDLADALERSEERLDAHSQAVEEALRALSVAEAELYEATAAAADAAAAAERTREAEAAARTAQRQAEQAERRAQRKLAAIGKRMDAAREQLGAVARAAYQNGGGLFEWSVVLEAGSPAELSDAHVGVRSVQRAADAALSNLAVDRADLRNTEAELRELREERERRADEATRKRRQAEIAEEAARQAQRRLAELRSAREEALAEAEAARAEEYERYQELLRESEQLAAWLAENSLDERLEGTGSFVRPGTGELTSEFGSRRHPILGYVKQHTGVDLSSGDGYIYAADHGVVAEATWNDAYGYLVVVDHGIIEGQHVSTLYAHQPGLSVTAGERVAKGEPIGSVGSTGFSTGPHLHFEVRIDGTPVDPAPWLASAPPPGG